MPRVKFDYVVSFSSESPDAPASNLLANEAGKGRWLCSKGEPSCSVLLQLAKAVQISSVSIGAHNTALVEVLVGRSETPSDPFQVLVASSVFLSPPESRRAVDGSGACERVRTFTTDQLAADVSGKRWDRLRIVCSQPYNKHCKYGLSFIHVFTPEGDTDRPDKPTSREEKPTSIPLHLQFDDQDSEDDDLKPGALFAKYRQSQSQDTAGSTDSQIRQATSKALKNIPDKSAQLVRTPISKPKDKQSSNDERVKEKHSSNDERVKETDRRSEKLMYDDEDARPHAKIDRVVAAHKDEQAKNSTEKLGREQRHKEKTNKLPKDKPNTDKHDRDSNKADSSHSQTKERDSNKADTSYSQTKERDKKKEKDSESHWKDREGKTNQSNKRDRSSSKKDDDDGGGKKAKLTKDDSGPVLYAGPVSSSPHTLLSGVHFVLSGYENPRRARVRDTALAMGATFHRDWNNQCTHLICAFPNTPKLRTVRSSPNGHNAVVVTAEWIERCSDRQRLLPWQWFATENKHKVQRARSASGEDPPGTSRDEPPSPQNNRAPTAAGESELDTDDEIERVLAKKRIRRSSSPKSNKTENSPSKPKGAKERGDMANSSHDSDVTFVRDERMRGNVTVSDSDSEDTTEEDITEELPQDLSTLGLPALFDGRTFTLHASDNPALDDKLIRRYIRAYGGEIVEPNDDEELEVDYIICLSGNCQDVRAKGTRLRGDWVWRCHDEKKLCSPKKFAI